MHSIRTDSGLYLLHSASKLKRGVIEGTGGCFWVSYLWIFLPQYFFLLFCCESFMETLSVNRFQSNLFYILHDIRLSSMFLWTFFFQCGFLCMFLVDFFFSQPDVNISWITGHIHRSIVDKVNPSSEYVELVYKKCIINYIGLHIFVKCDQKNLFNRKKYFWWTVTRTPPLFF